MGVLNLQLQNYIENTDEIILDSPLRKKLNSKDELPVEILKEDFKTVQKELKILSDKIDRALNLVVMGEVKAGKSTFINALIGREVSPVEVTETTASVIEIFYSENPQGIIRKKNSEDLSASPEEVFSELSSKRGNIDYFSNVLNVSLALPFETLKKLNIVDTPGLASITEENEAVTVNYIQKADVVLWLFNGNHLGQSDVKEKLAKAAKYGKPVIGIVNRVDEVDAAPERLKLYTQKKYDIYLYDIFTLSAYQAYEAKKSEDRELLKKSGYNKLIDYLENNIEKQSEEVQEESIISSLKSLINRDIVFHESYLRNIEFIKNQVEVHNDEIQYHNKRIKNSIESRLYSWARGKLFQKEKRELFNMVENMGALSGKKTKNEIKKRLNKLFSEDKIKTMIMNRISEMEEYFRSEWESSVETVHRNIKNNIEEFLADEQKLIRSELSQISSGDFLIDGIGQGVALGGSAAVAFAAYTAWLGPYAAFLTIGGELALFFPPFILAGIAAGGISRFFSVKKEKEKMKKVIIENIRDIKENQLRSEILPEIIKKINQQSDNIADEVKKKFVSSITKSWDEKEIQLLDNLKKGVYPEGMLAFISQKELLKFSTKITESTATIYDKALDAEYLRTHIGGPNHRLFDGGHDLAGAWEAIKNASTDDSFIQETASLADSLWKDLNTEMGLPFKTIHKSSYDEAAVWVSQKIPGADKSWFYDLLSFDSFEILAGALSAVGVLFALKNEELENLAELLGSIGIIAIISANPLLGILMILTAAYAYFFKKLEFRTASFSSGVIVSSVSMSIFAVLGFSLFFELILVLIVAGLIKNKLNKDISLKLFWQSFEEKMLPQS